jgi:hypothetical protein
MPASIIPEEEFIASFRSMGAAGVAKYYKLTARGVHARRRAIEKRLKTDLTNPIYNGGGLRDTSVYSHRIELGIDNGSVLIGSDAHIWPGPLSAALRGFIAVCKDIKPKVVILNGDVLDFPQISRHPPIGWQKIPSVHEEIEAAQDVLHDIEIAAGRGVQKIWTLGNHDARFSTTIASRAPELAKIKGVTLSDHFPNWRPAWSCFLNNDVVVKHRFKGGVGAARANALNAGRTMVTGHLHKLQVTGLTDYNGRRYGVDCGFMSTPHHKAFVDYTEDAPLDWCAGFAVLTFKNGRLLPPELAQVWDDNHVVWRGAIIRV